MYVVLFWIAMMMVYDFVMVCKAFVVCFLFDLQELGSVQYDFHQWVIGQKIGTRNRKFNLLHKFSLHPFLLLIITLVYSATDVCLLFFAHDAIYIFHPIHILIMIDEF